MDLLNNQTPVEAFFNLLHEPAVLFIIGLIFVIIVALYTLLSRN